MYPRYAADALEMQVEGEGVWHTLLLLLLLVVVVVVVSLLLLLSQTWNPHVEPAAGTVEADYAFDRPTVTLSSAAALADLAHVQARRPPRMHPPAISCTRDRDLVHGRS